MGPQHAKTGEAPRRAAGAPVPAASAEALLRAGDTRGAADELVRVHGPRVRAYLRALLRDEDDADDAYSLFEECVLTSLPRYQGASSLRTFAFGVACNAARRVRAEAWRRRRVRMTTGSLAARAAVLRTTSGLVRERRARCLDELRRRLSPRERNLLALRVEEGLGWEEVVDVLAASGERVTAPALRKRFERLKERIARLARERGGEG